MRGYALIAAIGGAFSALVWQVLRMSEPVVPPSQLESAMQVGLALHCTACPGMQEGGEHRWALDSNP